MPSTIRSQLEQDGYVVLEDFLRPAECDELAAAGRELAQQAAHAADKSVFSTLEGEKQQLSDSYFLESNDKIRFFFESGAVGSDGKLQVDPSVSLNKVGHALHLLHPIFRCYTFSDRVKAVCRELDLVEPSVVQSMYIYKNPGLGGEVIAHQDASYLYTEPIPPVGLWIALEDATVQNGCLWMAAGSHKSGVHRRLIRNPDKDAKQALVYDRAAPVYPQSAFSAVPVTKGTCVVIHGHVVHKSAHNKSDKSRHAYTFHVVERHNNSYSADNWLQEGRGAPFVNLYTTPQME
ncbi:phytanoyl-CoA dioxygenase domain-containing protein 1 isoform X1 [Bicyclus anynana]|uniref:Phytanoyl-CoA dioxygenase domain-containing protein 1 isoform X1 n=1 Tax=Bicyclus anynana TaxID=110368 RepID=A0A6J1NQE7_BICAN|nr:phytanoyl-CoA dioxygenase domain-containing protein 1 isoform X1 [Bicyclus anynana]